MIRRKIKSNKGESLVESLMTIMIIALIMAFLAQSITSANKINAKTAEMEASFEFPESATPTQSSIKIDYQTFTDETVVVNLYSNGYYSYYDVKN